MNPKRFLLAILFAVTFEAGLMAQNVVCVGNSINISLSDYKFGDIQWQFSQDGNTWTDLTGEVSSSLDYLPDQTGYYRAKITYGDCIYLADSLLIYALSEKDTANAGPDQYITGPLTQVQLSGNTPYGGSGKWTVVSGTGGSFTNDGDPLTDFRGNPCSDYSLQWASATPCSSGSDIVNIGFHATDPAANAGADRFISTDDTAIFLSGNSPVAGKGKWTVISGTGGLFENDSLGNTVFSGNPCSDYKLKWTILNDCSVTSDTVAIGFHPVVSVADAGGDQVDTLGNNTVHLNANIPQVGQGNWTILSGSGGIIENASDPKSLFTGKLCSDYILRWSISTPCDLTTDDVNIQFHPAPGIASAGNDTLVSQADTFIYLSAKNPLSGKGKWTVISGSDGIIENDTLPNARFTGKKCTAYILRWTDSTSCGTSTDDVNVGFFSTPSAANAGPDTIIGSEDTVTFLSAKEPANGTGTWAIISGSGGILSDPADPKSMLTGSECSDYVLKWTVSTPCSISTDDVKVSFRAGPAVANAGPDTLVDTEDTVTILSANVPAVGTGKWTIISGSGGIIENDTLASSPFRGRKCNDYILRWTNETSCSITTDDVVISFYAQPSISNAGEYNPVSNGDTFINLDANVPVTGTGKWSVISGEGGSFTDESDPKTIFSGTNNTTYFLRWTISTSCTISTHAASVVFNNP